MTAFLYDLQSSYDKVQILRHRNQPNYAPALPPELSKNPIPQSLEPIAKELDQLIAANVFLTNGQSLNYACVEGPLGQGLALKINVPRAIWITDTTVPHQIFPQNSPYLYTRAITELQNPDTLLSRDSHYMDSVERVLIRLVEDLAPEISDLGSLDKNIYSSKTQDILEIE
jgi:hypothetical protein